jgi:hypothetical protein
VGWEGERFEENTALGTVDKVRDDNLPGSGGNSSRGVDDPRGGDDIGVSVSNAELVEGAGNDSM